MSSVGMVHRPRTLPCMRGPWCAHTGVDTKTDHSTEGQLEAPKEQKAGPSLEAKDCFLPVDANREDAQVKTHRKPGMVVHAVISSTGEAETGDLSKLEVGLAYIQSCTPVKATRGDAIRGVGEGAGTDRDRDPW